MESTNYEFVSTSQTDSLAIKFMLNVINPLLPSRATIVIQIGVESTIKRTFTHHPVAMNTLLQQYSFGNLHPEAEKCFTFQATNKHPDMSMIVENVVAKNNPSIFTVTPSSFTLLPK